ncbi:hypothetical protein IAD21_04732 [Abditibacteriota bacterium]|nr:hypothetical protein IAD21_04732 [Abditibacteriota bacterium]
MRLSEPRSRAGQERGASRPQPMAEINIIPLVDVILVLLIIFMATTAFVKESGLKMQLPAAKTGGEVNRNNRDLTVVLTRDNLLYVDGRKTDEKALVATMKARVLQNPQLNVVIKGDQGIAYARVVRVMDLARQSGLASVALGTRQPQSAEAPQ